MPRGKNKLEKLLEEHQANSSTEGFEGRAVDEEYLKKLRNALVKHHMGDEEYLNYDPIIELAKIATDHTIKDELRAMCNREVASYMYPKVKSFEITKKEDKTVTVTLNIKGYAQAQEIKEVEPEDIEHDEEDDERPQAGIDYTKFVLGNIKPEGNA